jgi:opacity protein-like surface antigen
MQRRSLLVLSVSLALIAGGTVSAQAAQTVWSGLVIANNVARPNAIPPELDRIEDTLKELFGYNQFQVIGQSRTTLITGSEDWLASSKYFSLHVDSRGETNAGYLLNLKLFQEKNLLLETEAKLSKSSPLVIKGPQVGDGQLLLLLVVQ